MATGPDSLSVRGVILHPDSKPHTLAHKLKLPHAHTSTLHDEHGNAVTHDHPIQYTDLHAYSDCPYRTRIGDLHAPASSDKLTDWHANPCANCDPNTVPNTGE